LTYAIATILHIIATPVTPRGATRSKKANQYDNKYENDENADDRTHDGLLSMGFRLSFAG